MKNSQRVIPHLPYGTLPLRHLPFHSASIMAGSARGAGKLGKYDAENMGWVYNSQVADGVHIVEIEFYGRLP